MSPNQMKKPKNDIDIQTQDIRSKKNKSKRTKRFYQNNKNKEVVLFL